MCFFVCLFVFGLIPSDASNISINLCYAIRIYHQNTFIISLSNTALNVAPIPLIYPSRCIVGVSFQLISHYMIYLRCTQDLKEFIMSAKKQDPRFDVRFWHFKMHFKYLWFLKYLGCKCSVLKLTSRRMSLRPCLLREKRNLLLPD